QNRRRSKQRIENSNLEEQSHLIVTMTDNRTMAELLRAPTEGYAEAIVVPPILAEQFQLKHSLINMMTTDQFFGLEKDNPHDHIRWFNKVTSTIKYKDVPSSAIKLMLFPFSLVEEARRTTNLRNEISNFQQKFDESFHEAWDRYKDLLPACPHHGFTELHQLDTFYNALNPADQDSLNAAAEIAKLTHAVNQQTNVVTTAMTTILKQFQATPSPAPVKAVEEICVTCGGAHPYYQCLAAGGNTFPEFRDNIQGYVSAAAVNYNQGNPDYRPPEEDECVEEIFTDPDLAEYTIEVPPPPAQKYKPPCQREFVVHQRDPPVILKKLPKKLGDPGKFLILCGFSELKCKALAGLGSSINLMPLSVWKKLGLPELIPTRMTLELGNCAVCTPAGIARDVFIPVGMFTFPADFVIVDYESDLRVPLILGRPFLRTARALIDVHGEEILLHDGDERLTLNMRHDTSSYSKQPQKESINLINVFNNSKGCNVLSEKMLDLDSTKDLHPPLHDNPLSGSTTYPLLEEFADELPPEYDDNLQFDIEFDLKEIEFMLYQDKDSSLKDSIDQKNRAHLASILVDSIPA
nr:reverse transcriptase domain-containing protein [Tanacetum cinerariifolium]